MKNNISVSSPSKIILFGEHSVVYGEPAIAIPVRHVRAKVNFHHTTKNPNKKISPKAGHKEKQVIIEAADICERYSFPSNTQPSKMFTPLLEAFRRAAINAGFDKSCLEKIVIRSKIPVARGMGSGAAVSAAIIRGIFKCAGKKLSHKELSDMTYEIEKIQHGLPSGIDNTVIAFNKPVYFQKSHAPVFFEVTEVYFLIADTGIIRETKEVVEAVAALRKNDQIIMDKIISEMGVVARRAFDSLIRGDKAETGKLMFRNHELLQRLGVSCPELDILVKAAKEAGAYGAKLSGKGRGGVVIILLKNRQQRKEMEEHLKLHGSINVYYTEL